MERKSIRINRDGSLAFVNDPVFSGLLNHGKATIRRASHVEPIGRLARATFHLLRLLFGENGRVGHWTRRWKCPWRANLAPSNGPILSPFPDRQAAIDAEVWWLQNNAFGLYDG